MLSFTFIQGFLSIAINPRRMVEIVEKPALNPGNHPTQLNMVMPLTPYSIDDDTRSRFATDGVVLLPDAVSADQLAALQQAADQALVKSDNYFRRIQVWLDIPVLEDFCLRSQAPRIVAELQNVDKINLFYDQVFTKEAGTGVATPWHNDLPYWPVRGPTVATFWLALDDIGAENGAMEFIRGSHLWDRWFQPFVAGADGGNSGNYPATDPLFEPLPDFDQMRDELDIVSWDMKPGDALVFHSMIVHGAMANTSATRRRRGYAIRYGGGDTTYHEAPTNNPRLLNPELKHGDPLDSRLYPQAQI